MKKWMTDGGKKVTQDNLIANYTTSLFGTAEYYLRKTEAYDVSDEDFIKRVYYILRHSNGYEWKKLGQPVFCLCNDAGSLKRKVFRMNW